jgi:hypothetical protein
MPEGIDRDAGPEIQVSLPVARQEPGPLTPLENHIGARIGRQQRRIHGISPRVDQTSQPGPKNESAAQEGAALEEFYWS